MEAIKGVIKRASGFLIDYGGIIAFILIMGALVGAFGGVFHSFQQVLVEFLPFYMVTVAGAAALLVALISSLPSGSTSWIADASPEFQRLVIVLMLVAVVILVLSIVLCATCSTPRPYERFVDGSGATDPQLARLQADVAEAEEAVCKYITRADQFISGDVGPAGKKDPSLVTAAEEKARAGVNMVLCSDGTAADVAAPGTTPDLGDLENRIARLESTLSGFTGVVFKHSYDETVPCKEGFAVVVPTAADLEQRLAAVRQTIADQQTQYLGPIDQKTKDLQSGKASDCDKKRGAKLAAAGGPKAPAAPSSK